MTLITQAANVHFRVASGMLIANNFLGRDSFSIPLSFDQQRIAPFMANFETAVDRFSLRITTGRAGSVANVIIFDADANGRPTTLLFQSNPISTAVSGGTYAFVDGSFTFEAGRMYWIGLWTSENPSIQSASMRELGVRYLSGTHGVGFRSLVRTETHGGTSTDWSYLGSQHATDSPPLINMRVV